MVLALTRGLFFAPSIPHRNKNRFDTFTWFKHSDDIPLGCVIFTDGSLLDGSLPKGCQSLGWAFVVMGLLHMECPPSGLTLSKVLSSGP